MYIFALRFPSVGAPFPQARCLFFILCLPPPPQKKNERRSARRPSLMLVCFCSTGKSLSQNKMWWILFVVFWFVLFVCCVILYYRIIVFFFCWLWFACLIISVPLAGNRRGIVFKHLWRCAQGHKSQNKQHRVATTIIAQEKNDHKRKRTVRVHV